MHNFWAGLTSLGNASAIAYLVVGALVGMFVGVIPGLSTAVILSIMLVLVLHIPLTGTLCLFLGAQAGSYYSASVTSILLNTPAHPEAFAITFDGYPMARRGEPGRALGISACSTCVGGWLGCAIFVAFIPLLNYLPDVFHPPEYVALVVFALVLVGLLGGGSVTKGLISTGMGLVIASIGPSAVTGTLRFEFGQAGLDAGVSLVGLALGMFAIPQMVMTFGTATIVARQDMVGREVSMSAPAIGLQKGLMRQTLGGITETFHHWTTVIQGGLVGALVGLIPGVGGFTANFLSYGIARTTSKRRQLFGTGIAEGIIAPEGASLSKEAGSMVPIIGLGVPGSVGGALFLAALSLKDIHAGFGFEAAYPTIPYEIAWIVALSGLIGTAAGVLSAPLLGRVTKVPGPLLLPFIFSLSIIGAFLSDGTTFTVIEVVIFGVLGLGLRRTQYSLASFVMGLVLGPTLESNFYLTKTLDPGFTAFERSPMGDVLIALTILIIIFQAREICNEKKRQKTSFAQRIDEASDEVGKAAILRAQEKALRPYPLLELVMSTLILAFGLFVVVYGILNYSLASAVMPVFGGFLCAIPLVFIWPNDIYAYVEHRRFVKTQRAFDNGDVQQARFVATAPTNVFESAFVGAASIAGQLETSAQHGNDVGISVVPSDIKERSWGFHGEYGREVMAFVWLIALTVACYLFGYKWGISLFMASYGLTCTKRFFKSMVQRVFFAAGSTAVMWLLMFEAFHLISYIFIPKIHL